MKKLTTTTGSYAWLAARGRWLFSVGLLLLHPGCSITGIIDTLPCSGHGEPTHGAGGPACVCHQGYRGLLCHECSPGFQDNDDDNTCLPDCGSFNGCGSHGVCDDTSGERGCVCDLAYQGPGCQQCQDGFQDNDGDGSCEVACETLDETCGGHGACDDSGGLPVCQCEDGYQDHDQDFACQQACDHPQMTCDYGQCVDLSGPARCDCDDGYTGLQCDQCSAGHQDNDLDGTCMPSCETAAYLCSGHGLCDDLGGTAHCECNQGYESVGVNGCTAISFIATAVDDDLSQDDLIAMADGLEALGYQRDTVDRDTTKAEMVDYITRPVTILYHTGHGSDGSASLANGRYYAGDAAIEAGTVIWATCMTLTTSAWMDDFTTSTKNIFGYTNYSYDGADTRQVREYLAELEDGRTHLQAWYLSNIAISSLRDRWAAYSRTDDSVVEFSARSGHDPQTKEKADWVSMGAAPGLRVSASLLADDRRFADSYVEATVLRRAEGRAVATHFEGGRFGLLKPAKMPEQSAIDQATAWLMEQDGLPPDAALAEVIAIESRTSPGAPAEIVGYVVTYGRMIAGLRVRGNLVADHITVLVGAQQIVASTRYWPQMLVDKSARSAKETLTVAEAIAASAKGLSSIVKHMEFDISEAASVYGTRGPDAESGEIVPAYALKGSNGLIVVVSALTGLVLF